MVPREARITSWQNDISASSSSAPHRYQWRIDIYQTREKEPMKHINRTHSFGGRIRPKKEKHVDWANLVELTNEGLAFIYQRLSSHEQVKKHVYSLQAQNDLVELARRDGYSEKESIYVECRDLGISGTKGQEEREGLAYLVAQIEAGVVESIYVVHISRLFRDQTLINAFAFGELCKQHKVIIVTPQMRLNLNDRMHMRIYRMEAERAADELEVMRLRLHGGQNIKGRQGCYVGSSIPPGYVLDVRKKIDVDGNSVDNPNYHKYEIYEPHAEVVRKLFRMAKVPGTTVPQIVRCCRAEGTVFVSFPEELAKVRANVKAFAQSKKNPDGSWPLTAPRVRSILRNPAYIGWWVWKGEMVKTDNHPPIVDEGTFWAVQEIYGDRPHRPKGNHPPLPLSGLLYCGDHDVPKRMVYSYGNDSRMSTYQCRDDLNATHCIIRANYLDGPIGEAVVSQCAYPKLADQVLDRLTQEYEETRTRTSALHREHERLTREVENLEHNFANAKLTPERAMRIEAQIQKRLAQIKELSNIQNTEVGKLVGSTITQDDVELVKRFLANLEEGWEDQPPDLQNAFLRLVLDQVTIWHTPASIRVHLTWRTGLEQELVIYRPYHKPYQPWVENEVEILKAHFETMPRKQLMARLPNRTWKQARAKGRKLGLKRKTRDKPGGGHPYAPWEEEIVKQHHRGELSMAEAMERLNNRTEDSVRSKMKQMGLRRDYSARPEWEWVGDTHFSTTEHRVGQEE
jgi:DNA invertase Pin-like site-specific DNA recombinase